MSSRRVLVSIHSCGILGQKKPLDFHAFLDKSEITSMMAPLQPMGGPCFSSTATDHPLRPVKEFKA